MREKEKERGKKKESDTKSYPHDYKRNKFFLREGERKEKSYATSRVRISLFFLFWRGPTLYTLLYNKPTTLLAY